jgi:hypothetical protein
MNEFKSEITIDGESYKVRALTFDEYLEFSKNVVRKTLLKAPVKSNIEKLPPAVTLSLMTRILLLTSQIISRETSEFQKIKS